MTEKQLYQVKKSIENSILTTKNTIASLEELTKPISPENAIGRVSRMDAINNKSVNEAALRNLKNKLTLLEAAIQRVNQKSFGLCNLCNLPIPIQRILLMPQSNRCVNCASK